jgi:hypothetical protein
MKTLDARVGDLVEWYDYKDKVKVWSHNNIILLYNHEETYFVFGSVFGIYKEQYQQKYKTTLPRKIK